MLDEQAKKAREQTKQLKGKERWKNFIYYYKYHIFVVIFVAMLVAFTISECTNKVNYDLEISCYSATLIDSKAQDKLEEELSGQIEDITGNDKNEVGLFINFASLSDPTEQNQTVIMKLSAELASGTSMGYIFDEGFYDFISENSSECFDSVILISDIPSVKEQFGLQDGQNLYWATKTLYENEKNKEDKIKAHENALKIEEYFNSLKKASNA